MVLKITRQDGIPTGGGKKYTPINKAFHSIIKQFIIQINETFTIIHSSLQCLHLNHSEFNRAPKKSYLTKALYYKDKARHVWKKWIALLKITV